MNSFLKTYISFLFFFIFIQITIAEDDEEYVQINYSIKPDTLRPNSEAKIFFNFIPKDGIMINLDPPIELEIDKNIVTPQKLEFHKIKGDKYLDYNKPVIQSIKLNKKIKSGKIKLKAQLIYYYCSEEEGWCSKAKKPIELNIIVKK